MVTEDFSARLECDRDAPGGYDVVERHQDPSGPPFQRKAYNNDVSVNDRPTFGGEVEGPHPSSSDMRRSALTALLDG